MYKFALTAAVGIAVGVTSVPLTAPAAHAAPYSSCDQAQAAGAAPIYAGQPGYSRRLDRDGDGIACDQGGSYMPAPVAPPLNTATPVPTLPIPTAAPAPAAAPTETCDDWGKLRINPTGGEEQVCGAISSPATIWYWIPAGEMPGGVHDAGSTCSDQPLFTFGRTPNDYQVWCAEGTSVGLPGGGVVTNPPIPIWGLYSP